MGEVALYLFFGGVFAANLPMPRTGKEWIAFAILALFWPVFVVMAFMPKGEE